MSIQSEINRLKQAVSDAFTAIGNKGGTVPTSKVIGNLVSAINSIQVGGNTSTPSAGRNDVTFIDYDGTELYQYSLSEAAELTDYPPAPTHDGLVFQEWNYSLEEIRNTTETIIVGPNFTTSDGKTRLYLTFRSEDDVKINLALYVYGTIAINWGDGSDMENVKASGPAQMPHEYTVDNYPTSVVIEIEVLNGEFELGGPNITGGLLRGNGTTLTTTALTAVEIGDNMPWINSYAFGNSPYLRTVSINTECINFSSSKTSAESAWHTDGGACGIRAVAFPRGTTTIRPNTYFKDCKQLRYMSRPRGNAIHSDAFANCYSLTSITIPEGVTSIGSYAFQYCYSLTSITIPEGVTSIGSYAFNNCHSLASITIPEGVTSIGIRAFANCYSLASITIPEGVTSIGSYSFQYCYSLASITIPDGVTSIGSYAFDGCCGMRYCDFTACTSVPALSSTNAFSGIPSDCQMLIPAALYDEWSAATNWATFASYMVAV